MTLKITQIETRDVRFPTSKSLDGSDAVNKDPDYSAAYAIVRTNNPSLTGYGFTFTEGRGNEICCAAIKALAYHLTGKTLKEITSGWIPFIKSLTGDTQIRWLGPEKGAIHMACGAIINAVWDLYAKTEKKPVWKLIADMTPEQIVSVVDFTYLTDAITQEEALQLLKNQESTKQVRIDYLMANGYPAYNTSVGWMGYSEEKIRRLSRAAKENGWSHVKMKVGGEIDEDVRRAEIIREEIGYEIKLMMDANQKWEVGEAIENMKKLAKFEPWWIEEPTSPDDIAGHLAIAKEVAPVKVATGEVCQNRVMFKQFIKSGAIGICQIDSCRVAGINEVLSIMLMAAKYGIPVCPHAGGVGLCEYVQHLSMIDFICISGNIEDRIIEYVDHLHEHFINPVIIKNGKYMPPMAPGYSVEMKQESMDDYTFPTGKMWRAAIA